MVPVLNYGMIIGRSFPGLVQNSQVITFSSYSGLVFLIFLAGEKLPEPE